MPWWITLEIHFFNFFISTFGISFGRAPARTSSSGEVSTPGAGPGGWRRADLGATALAAVAFAAVRAGAGGLWGGGEH